MTVVFISNYLTHHQLPFCTEMKRLTENRFYFIATEPIEQEKLTLGYADMNHDYDFVICTFDGEIQRERAKKLISESDVVIQGGSSTDWIRERLENTDMLTVRYIERLFKRGFLRMLSPRAIINNYRSHTKYRNKNFYLLCAGAYVAGDCKIIGAYKNKMYKWGYFTQVIKYEDKELQDIKKSQTVRLMWAGRFIDWKHSDYCIEAAEKLKADGYDFRLDMIGTGELFDSVKAKAQRLGLDGCICFHGSMPPEDVRKYMEKADIYLLTSDYNEGWGAVLNEAMNSGCAVVASHAAGAVPFLIEDGKNGMIFRSGNTDDMYRCVKYLIENPEIRAEIGKNAYKTVSQLWSPETAAKRLIMLLSELLYGNKAPKLFESGPCSIASPVPQRKMYSEIKEKTV